MAEKKDIKLNIKNSQIADAINLGKLKEKLSMKKAETEPKAQKTAAPTPEKKKKAVIAEEPQKEEAVEEKPRRKARSQSVFAEVKKEEPEEVAPQELKQPEPEVKKEVEAVQEVPPPTPIVEKEVPPAKQPPAAATPSAPPVPAAPVQERLGPTGRHVNDILPPKKPKEAKGEQEKAAPRGKTQTVERKVESPPRESVKGKKFKEFRDVKPAKKGGGRSFDSRDRQGLRSTDDDSRWRKRRPKRSMEMQEETIRPTELSIRLPISIKDLAAEMKLKASQLIAKLFAQGMAVTINDVLDDETTVQLLGEEFGCAITIDKSEEERIQITGKTIAEEIAESDASELRTRPPVVTFMGHVDHGKTSLIDYIRKSNVASGEAGDITQHIGAFLCKTSVGEISVLDTPGHEAFTSMRARGADVTDIVVLVIAGNEGMRAQTVEALEQALAAEKTIVVAINKSDTPNFNAETVYRQLADKNLLPESWGGQTITINCSAKTGEGINELLEMLALQAEILELKANPSNRARGRVIESELHKGMGAVATVLVQNGTLRIGDPLVFEQHWARVKTMRDEFGKQLQEAGPSTPVEITGLSGIPEAGQEFIAVKDEKEARNIAEVRMHTHRQKFFQQRKAQTFESAMMQTGEAEKKVLHIVLRADVQGSLEALQTALMKIKSDKVELNIVSTDVGEISESDVELSAASNAVIIGFHTGIESHAEPLVKRLGVNVKTHDIIYHVVDDVKGMMKELLDKIPEEVEKGKAEVRAIFKSSQLGIIAGCIVTEGSIHRNHQMRVKRDGELLWKGSISSLKRVKEDVREVQKGLECGIVLSGFKELKEGDILESYEINYITQEI